VQLAGAGNSTGIADLQLHYNAAPIAQLFKATLERNASDPSLRKLDIATAPC